MNMTNSQLLSQVLQSLFTVTGRRTSQRFAYDIISSLIDMLQGRFDFLKYIQIKDQPFSTGGSNIAIHPAIDGIDPKEMGPVIESLLRIVSTDLGEDAGLYFIKEFKQNAGFEAVNEMGHLHINLDQIKMEQQHIYQRRVQRKAAERAKKIPAFLKPDEAEDQLGYTWNNVTSWKHKPGTNECVLYDKDGNVLDRLNIDRIIQNYVQRLSGEEDENLPELKKEANLLEKEYELLELMHNRDMDSETAAALLHVTEEELNEIIQKLSKTEMIHFTEMDTVELTDSALHIISKNDKKGMKSKQVIEE